MQNEPHKVGLFDSGVGGLSVLRAVRDALPDVNLIYFADQKHCPYGRRPPEEIRALSHRIVEFLSDRGCRVIVVACNTASAAALYYLRATFPQLVFVGMEPAVKPAASASRSGKVAVLATQGTLDGELFVHTRDTHAREIQVITVYPKDWVERVERGDIDSDETIASVRSVIAPLVADGVDEIALGCTHYPFLIPVIERFTRGQASILDPSAAVAQQTSRVLPGQEGDAVPSPPVFLTSGDQADFQRVLINLLGTPNPNVEHKLL